MHEYIINVKAKYSIGVHTYSFTYTHAYVGGSLSDAITDIENQKVIVKTKTGLSLERKIGKLLAKTYDSEVKCYRRKRNAPRSSKTCL